MARVFNTSGPCYPKDHYMLPAEERLPEARRLIDLNRYFVLHAPRQTGKTTTVAALAESLNTEGRYTALLASCEEAQAAGEDINRGIATGVRVGSRNLLKAWAIHGYTPYVRQAQEPCRKPWR